MGLFRKRDDGQDLAEYCLLMAFIALVALGLILKTSGGIQGIWSSANTTLATTASQSVSSAAGGQGSDGDARGR